MARNRAAQSLGRAVAHSIAHSNHREAVDRSSHPGAAVRPRKAVARRVEARHANPIRVLGAEAARHDRVR